MIKHNCGGPGLTDGLRGQVRRLVEALNYATVLHNIRVHLYNHTGDFERVETVLEPFQDLANIGATSDFMVTGDVTHTFGQRLVAQVNQPSR